MIPEKVKEHAQALKTMVSPDDVNTIGLLRQKWGESALDDKRYPGLFEELKRWHGVDLQSSMRASSSGTSPPT